MSPANEIVYRRDASLDLAEVQRVYRSSGIRRPVEDAERIAAMFANANLVISAWHDARLVGVARALTDWRYCCYLSDLAVELGYQRRGIGSGLIAAVADAIGEECTLVLVSAPDAAGFYPKLGLENADNVFLRRRSR